MKVSEINNSTFGAKIVRNSLMEKAIAEAKKAPEYEKKAFYNALDLIHDDLTLKSVEINNGKQAALGNFRHIVTVTYQDNYINTYSNSVNNRISDGIEAMQSIFKFIEEHYGKRILQLLRVKRMPANTNFNEKIDEVLKANSYRYMF